MTKKESWPIGEVLALANVIYRKNGYVSTTAFVSGDRFGHEEVAKWNNKEHLIYQLIPEMANQHYTKHFEFAVLEEDRETADAIIKYFRRLSFGVLSDQLTDFMKTVFKITQSQEVHINELGIIACIPSVYDKEIQTKELLKKIKTTEQSWIGDVGKGIQLNICYLKTRYLPKLNCYAHEAITDSNHLVTFLNAIELGKEGICQKVKGRVKKHSLNYNTKTTETQLNYVKVVDIIDVWN